MTQSNKIVLIGFHKLKGKTLEVKKGSASRKWLH